MISWLSVISQSLCTFWNKSACTLYVTISEIYTFMRLLWGDESNLNSYLMLKNFCVNRNSEQSNVY